MKKEIENGFIEYRMPNIPEGLKIVSLLGDTFKKGELEMISEIILGMENLIKEININGKKLTYKKALNDFSLLPVFTEIATEILQCFDVDDKKKA